MSTNMIIKKRLDDNNWEELLPITAANNVKTSDGSDVESKIIFLEDQIKKIKPKIYGFEINEDDSNPDTRVTYTDDCIGFKPIRGNNGNTDYGSWENTFILNKNYTEYDKLGNMFACFEQTWYKWQKTDNIIKFKIADHKVDNSYQSYAFISEKTKELKDKMYIGCYEGSVEGALRSKINKYPSINTSISQFRDYAKANGEGYTIDTFSKYQYVNALLILVTKSTDLQSAIGKGLVNNSSPILTNSVLKGRSFYGDNSGTYGCKVFHIENWWGNYNKFLDGLYFNKIYNGFFISEIGPYTNNGMFVGSINQNSNGFIKNMQYSMYGLLPQSVNGSSTTHYCDRLSIGSSDKNICMFGGNYSDTLAAGPFNMYLDINENYISPYCTARLCYS